MCDSNCTTFVNRTPVTLYVAAFYSDSNDWISTGVCPANSQIVLPIRGYQVLVSADPIEQASFGELNAAKYQYKNGLIATDSNTSASGPVTLQNGTQTTMRIQLAKLSSDQNYSVIITLDCSNCGPDVVSPTDRLGMQSYNNAQPSNSTIVRNTGNVPLYVAAYYSQAGDKWCQLGFVFPGKATLIPLRGYWVLVSTVPIMQFTFDSLQPVVVDNYASHGIQVGVADGAQTTSVANVTLPDGTSNVPMSGSIVSSGDNAWVLSVGAKSPAAGPTSAPIHGGNSGGLNGGGGGMNHTVLIIIIAVGVVLGLLLLYWMFSGSSKGDTSSAYRNTHRRHHHSRHA